MKFTSPLPQPLPKECIKAANIFQSFVDNSNNGLDGVIPREVLENAKGFAVFTVIKAGLVFSARAGSGVVIAKLDNGAWSAPSAIGIAGLGLGGQLGAEMTDFLIVLNSNAAIRTFMAAGSLTLGGNMSLSIGPLGRNSEASGALDSNGKVAAMYSYSRSRGLFGGLSIEGSVIVERQDANVLAYDSPVTSRLLLGGTVPPPPWAIPLIKTLETCTGLPGNRQWVNDEGNRTPGGSYVFGGLASPSSGIKSPSFLRRKKKDSPTFPPNSWGQETNDGSYFTEAAPYAHSRNMTWDGTRSSPGNNGIKFDPTLDAKNGPSYPFARDQPVQLNPGSPRLGPKATLNPFSSNNNRNSVSYDAQRSETRPSSKPSQSHRPSQSLNFNFRNRGPLDEEDDDLYTPPVKPAGSPIKPFIKSRGELTKPLLPHEGVARAIALFDFKAVEAGDLSFTKGDIIIITQKSTSTDDWWTGKIGDRQGIFPANFVEVA